jgi:hypothetical protein
VGCAQEQIYFNRIQDSDEDILGAILRTFNAAPKYNPTLLQSDTDSAADTPQQVRQWICASQFFLLSLFIKIRRLKSFPLERALCATQFAMLLWKNSKQTQVSQCLLLSQNQTNGVFDNVSLHSNLNSNEQLQVTHMNDSIVAQMALVGPGLNPMQEPWSQLGYLHHSSTQDDVKGVTHWVVADIDSQVYSLPTFIPTSVFCVSEMIHSVLLLHALCQEARCIRRQAACQG